MLISNNRDSTCYILDFGNRTNKISFDDYNEVNVTGVQCRSGPEFCGNTI